MSTENRAEVVPGTYIWAATTDRCNPPSSDGEMVTGVMVYDVDEDPDDWCLHGCTDLAQANQKAEQARALYLSIGPDWKKIGLGLSD